LPPQPVRTGRCFFFLRDENKELKRRAALLFLFSSKLCPSLSLRKSPCLPLGGREERVSVWSGYILTVNYCFSLSLPTVNNSQTRQASLKGNLERGREDSAAVPQEQSDSLEEERRARP
jgi:hypothetical protein